MDCPRCLKPTHPARLEVGEKNLEALRCKKCRGHWIAQEHLATLEQNVDVVLFEWIKLPGDETQARSIYCPRCEPRKVMDKLLSGKDSRVVMDVCGQCHGLWLDYGEFEALTHKNVFSAVLDAVRFVKES